MHASGSLMHVPLICMLAFARSCTLATLVPHQFSCAQLDRVGLLVKSDCIDSHQEQKLALVKAGEEVQLEVRE